MVCKLSITSMELFLRKIINTCPSFYSRTVLLIVFQYQLNLIRRWVRVLDRGLVVHAEEAAINLCPYGFLCNLGNQ